MAASREDYASDFVDVDADADDRAMHHKPNPYASPERPNIAFRAPSTPYGTSYARSDVPGFGFLGTSTDITSARQRGPQTPPRSAPGLTSAGGMSTTFDDIPMATILHHHAGTGGVQRASAYGVAMSSASGHQPSRQYQSSSSMTASSSSYTSIAAVPDALMNDMFSSLNLGLPPSSAISTSGMMSSSAFTTPPRSPMYEGVRASSSMATSATTPPPTSPRTQHSLYKTELCRSWEESGACRYGHKCQVRPRSSKRNERLTDRMFSVCARPRRITPRASPPKV